MKKTVIVLIALFMWCTPAAAKLNVVATLPWIGSVTEAIGKDRINVTVLVKPSQDPHQIEAKPSMILAARNADLLIYNGLDLEIGYVPLLIESSRNPKIQPGHPGNLDCSQFIDVIEKHQAVDRSMGDVHPLGNPHYHMSPTNMARIVRGITRTLYELDPTNSAFYTANLKSLEDRLKEKQKEWSRLPVRGKRFVAYHKYFEYMAKEFGFELIGYVEEKPGIPPSAGYLERLVESMKRTKPDGILVTPYYGRREVEALSRMTGVKTIIVPHDIGSAPGATDWFSLMDTALQALK